MSETLLQDALDELPGRLLRVSQLVAKLCKELELSLRNRVALGKQ
jgi:hypothetical protein